MPTSPSQSCRRGLALCMVWLAAVSGVSAVAQTVRVTAGETIRSHGAAVEALFAQAQVPVTIEYLPNERALRQFLSGESDAEFPRTRTAVADVAGEVDFIGPTSCFEVAVFAPVGANPDLATYKGLAQRRVGVMQGDRLAQRLATENALSFEAINGREAMYRMLNAGRLDAVIDAELSGRTAIVQLKLADRLARAGPLLHLEPTYLVLRRRVPGLAQRLDAVFQTMRRSGEWARLIGDLNVVVGLPREFGLRCVQR